mgnify:CR=1 FL=1
MLIRKEVKSTGVELRKRKQAVAEFRALIDAERIEAQQPLGPATVYTALVTVWLLIYQRLQASGSLLDAVNELIRTDPQHLPDNRRVQEGTLSTNTGSYSRARTRLNPEVTDDVAHHIFSSLMKTVPPSIAGRRAFLLDGTTLSLAPTPALKKAFPPAPNQHGKGVWPIAHLLVAHELESGCALLPEVGPKFGPEARSEPQLTHALLGRLPANSIVIADRNFGIFSVAFAAKQAGHDALLRMTKQRFLALQRRARPVPSNDPNHPCWKLAWKPSKKDRQSNPDLPADAQLDVLLYEVRISDTLTLFLLTTWPCDAHDVARIYGKRLDVETDIRDVKVLLKTEQLSAKSVSMLRKELAVSIITYNLVVQVRRLAAHRAGVVPRRISFSGTWSAVRVILLSPSQWTADDWLQKFELAIRSASQRLIPHRPGRSYPRRALTKRNKSTNSQRSKPPQPPQNPPSTPPAS